MTGVEIILHASLVVLLVALVNRALGRMPAATRAAGLRPDDVIIAVNGTDARDLQSLFDGPTRTVHRLLVRRGEQDHHINLTMGSSMFPVRLDGTVGGAACRSFGPRGES